jgi:peptide-methionine (S)-S-oxide reductase
MARASSAAAVSILVALVLLVTAASGARLPARAGGGTLPRGGGTLPRGGGGGGVTATAVFALGSFWRSEAAFGCLPGVIRTSVGYAGGSKANPEYRNLADHAECVKVARELIPIHCAVVLVH